MGSFEGRRISLLLLIILVSVGVCQSVDLQRAYAQRGASPSEEVLLLPKKRPFCNAFTGCGRKRSGSGAPGMPLPELVRQRQLEDEALNGLLEMSGEPASEELSRQILSEARMWEAMQQAGAEISRRRGTNYPLGYNTQ